MSRNQMNPKQLALRIATLEQSARETLLAELPESKRQELQELIRELEPIREGFSAFELAMVEAEMAASPNADSFDAVQLQQLLAGEPFVIKQHLIDIFVRDEKDIVTPHVRTLISQYLGKKAAVLPARTANTRPWWKVWN